MAIISPVSTSRTPGISHALLVSIERIRACASGLRRISMCSMPGQHDVVDVVALAADEAVVLDPLAAGAEAADLDLVERLVTRRVASPRMLVGRPQDGLDDVLVAGAAAEVARQGPADLVLGRVGVARRAAPWRVIIIPGVQNPHCSPCSSLKPSWIGCSSLAAGQPLDGGDLVPVGLDGEHRAALDRHAVEQHGARAAVASCRSRCACRSAGSPAGAGGRAAGAARPRPTGARR